MALGNYLSYEIQVPADLLSWSVWVPLHECGGCSNALESQCIGANSINQVSWCVAIIVVQQPPISHVLASPCLKMALGHLN